MSRNLIFTDIPVITPNLRPDLESIDAELVWIILQNLSISNIQNLCNTSKRFRGICRGPEFERIIQQKIEELKPRLVEMSYQDILETCKKYPILQGICENDDIFWEAKLRRDVKENIFGSIDLGDYESLKYFYDWIPEEEELKFDKDFYEELLTEYNFDLPREGIDLPEVLATNLRAGYYLESNRKGYLQVFDEAMKYLYENYGERDDDEYYEGYSELAKAIIEKFNPEISDNLRTLIFDPEEWEEESSGYSSGSED